MAGEPQERIGIEIVVLDNGTPAVKRHTEETRRALGEVERSSKSSSAAVSGGMRTAGSATEGLGRTMEKSRAAAMALAGGLSQAGGRAAMASSAISQLVVTGLNPLGLALAAASIGIGILVQKHGEGAEAAERHAQAFRSLYEDIQRGSAAIREARFPGLGSAPTQQLIEDRITRIDALKNALDSELRQREERLGDVSIPFGISRGLVGITGLEEQSKALAEERVRLQTELTRLQGKGVADSAKQLALDEEGLRLAREKMELGTLVILQRTADERSRRSIAEANRQAALEIRNLGLGAPQVGGVALSEFDPGALADRPSVLPFDTDNADADRFRRMFEKRAQAIRESTPWFKAGTHAGDAMVDGISSTLTAGALTGELDLHDLGKTMGETLVRSFMDAFVQAAIGDQMRAALQNLFASIGGAIGLGGGGGGAPTDNTVTFAPSSVTARGPGVTFVAEVAPPAVIVASERVLASVPDEALRARIAGAQINGGAPGRRG